MFCYTAGHVYLAQTVDHDRLASVIHPRKYQGSESMQVTLSPSLSTKGDLNKDDLIQDLLAALH